MAASWLSAGAAFPNLALVLQELAPVFARLPSEEFESEDAFWQYQELKFTLR